MSGLLAALAIAGVGEACIANQTRGTVALLAEQASADNVRIKFFRKDIAPGAQVCLSDVWERGRPISVIVSKPNDTDENPHQKTRCPTVMPGADVRLVVSSDGDRLVCRNAVG